MNIVEFLNDLAARQISVWLESGQLGYRAPRDALKPQLLSTLKQYKPEIVAFLRERAAVASGTQRSYPLSQGQLGLWLDWQAAPQSPRYNLLTVYSLPAGVDLDVLRRAAQALLSRHPILRTIYPLLEESDEAHPVQMVQAEQRVDFEIVDGTGFTQSQVAAFIQATAERPFDLLTGPIMRMAVLRTASIPGREDAFLLWTIHHIATDYSTQQVLLTELGAGYERLRAGAEQAPLPDSQLTYHDFVRWEQDVLRTKGEQLRAFWQSYLGSNVPLLDLPERPGSTTAQRALAKRESFSESRSISFVLDPLLAEKLRGLSRAQRTTLNTVLLSAYALLIHRYTQQENFLINAPAGMRALPGWANTVGYFVNPLILSVDFTGISSFVELLRRTHENYRLVLDHQMYPYLEVLRHLHKQAGAAQLYAGIIGFVFVSRRQSFRETAPFEPRRSEQGGRPQALTLTVFEGADEISGLFTYDEGRFETAFIERLSGHLQNLLVQIVEDPGQALHEFPLLTPAERRQLLVEWNDTASDFPRDKCIHQLFEEQTAKQPDTVAVVFQNQQLTYGELNCRANQLAHRLRSLGIGANTLVALCVERSLEMIVGLLGILKAGGAYVPIDPGYPKERIDFMLKDAQPAVVLTQRARRDRLPHSSVPSLDIDETSSFVTEPVYNPSAAASVSELAYVIYTSGSTGLPKAVANTHVGCINLLFDCQRRKPLDPKDRCSLWTSLSFDVSVYEIFSALLFGATLEIPTEEIRSEPAAFLSWLYARRISSAYVAPLLLPSLLDLLRKGAGGPPLRRLLVGVEPIPAQLLWEIATLLPDLCILNGYGPTEASICATLYQVSREVKPDEMRNTPIGQPVANCAIFILDRQKQPLPIGAPGELHIGGAGLARGYLNRPELTAEKFIRNPFSRDPSERLYKTGDLACFMPDGNIEFLGRIDHQVKLRGFRIELGEIEVVLASHPQVAHTAVVLREDSPGDKRLCAYVVSQAGTELDQLALREYLGAKLPEYMIPSAFVALSALPLTPNGKLDRRALPTPSVSATQPNHTMIPPRTPTERTLCDLFCAVLRIEQVGIFDSFFALGGHSLLATQLISRIQKNWAVQLPLRTLFENPTIAALSIKVEQAARVHEVRPIPRADRSQPLPLSFAQERLWFLDRLGDERCIYNMPSVLRLRGALDLAALQNSLRAVVCRHESLRTTFPAVLGNPVQRIEPEGFRLPFVDLSALSSDERELEIERLVRAEVHHVFDLACGPLFRATIARLCDATPASAEEHLIIFNTHHIIFDGWSMKVFHHDVAALYAAYCQGQPSPLPEPTLQYADFALWQRGWLADKTMAAQLSYWREQLAGAPQILSLPTDRPRPPVQTHQGAHYHFRFPAALAASLRALCIDTRSTLFMVCLAAWKVLLMRYSGQTDIVVGSPIANRNNLSTEPLIGFFVNNLVLRSDLSGELRFLELLERIKSTTLDAYRHQDVPFGKVVEALQPERNLDHSPLFQVMFDLFDRTSAQLDLPGLTVETLDEIEFPFAKFDLTLSILDEPSAESERQLGGRIEYNTDLFDRSTMVRMAAHYERLLQGIVDDPRQSVHTLPMLGAAERPQILVGLNEAPSDPGKCFHVRFEEQAARTPDAVAVVFDDCKTQGASDDSCIRLTYRELNQRANRLARHLRVLGVRAETLVGLCVERSPEIIVALLAIWKAGGAYVPLDPAYPAERLAFMLDDSQVSLLVTNQSMVTALLPCAAPLLCLDKLVLDGESSENLDVPVSPDDLAYLIYTSGSTGKPKGVLVEHRSLCHTSDAQVQALGVGAEDRHLLFFSLSFDGGLADVILPLRCGASLYLAPQQEIMPGAPLYRFLQKHAISTVILTPSALAQLPDTDLPALRTVMTAGEACPAELVSRWAQSRRFLNLYGVTEAAILSTVAVCTADGRTPTIGRPIHGNQICILDPSLQPVPVGIPGELYIGGPGVARGYHNRPELTESRFLGNPFGPGRMYRTGDLGRYVLPSSAIDGVGAEIEFLGRRDHQIKLRGFRIELAEIESVLRQHPELRDAVVVARNEKAGKTRLVAYAVAAPSSESPPTAMALRAFLQAKLPDYMVPSAIVLVDSLPLTANGKVDRQALPEPQSQEQYVAPKSAIERQMTTLWQELLQVDRVSVHDNFFELGGHSLLLTRLHGRLEQTFGRSFALTDLFRHPTIAALAAYIANDGSERSTEEVDDRLPSGGLRATRRAHEASQRNRRF